MFRNILFTMSLSGSIVVVFYILLYPLAQKYFLLVWRYRLLKVAIFFYLIPLVECKYYVFNLLRIMFPKLWDKIYIEPNFDISYSTYIGNGFIKFSPSIYKIVFILFMCGIISGLIFFRTVIWNRKIKKMYLAGSGNLANPELQEVLLEIQQELNIKKRIKLICSEYCRSPVTSGVIFPVIWFPEYKEKEIDKKALRYMIKHELLHIQRNDILVKHLGLLVVAIHWFNPFSYFLYHELSDVGEMYCDNGVLEGQGETERKEYGELLLQAAVRKTSNNRYSLFAGMADKGYQKVMKRRIMEMKIVRKNKMVFSLIAMIFSCILGGLTAFAYESPYKITGVYNDNFSFEDNIVEVDNAIEHMAYEQYFTDQNEIIFDIEDLDSSERIGCVHNYVDNDSLYAQHIRNNNGSCTMTMYKTKKCTLCASIVVGNKLYTTIFEECPH